MFESLVELFHIMEDWFGKETAIWMVVCTIGAIILTALNAGGIPDRVVKKTGEDKWTIFTFRR